MYSFDFYYDNPIEEIVYYYDRHIRLWTIYPVDKDGNQLCAARYAVRRAEMLDIVKELNERG